VGDYGLLAVFGYVDEPLEDIIPIGALISF
jgi:hypothetical protein